MSVTMVMEERGAYRSRKPTNATLGELLRGARTAMGHTQAQLAERAGISERGISDIERGIITSPNMSTMRALMAALDLSDHAKRAFLEARGPRVHRRLAPRALPVPVTPLVDRVDEVAELSRLVPTRWGRLVSLLGPGGVGKSRLALALAAATGHSFRDRAVFVALEDATDLFAAMQQILVTLNAPVNIWEPLPAQVLAALRGREMLLVLDNVEQLPIGAYIVDLLMNCPQLRIVTTSRQPLQVRGEHRYEVRPLALPTERWVQTVEDLERAPATALFLQCARCLSVELPLTEQNRIDIDAICRLAEGVPLRIEQAASLLSTRSPSEIAHQMRDPLACLRSASADLPARHQSLEASIRWSYDLLTLDEQWLLRLVSAFDDDFTDDAIHLRARIMAGGPATQLGVAQCLRALVEKHLIVQRRDVDGAYYLLPAHLRAFARAQAALREQAGAVRARG